MSKSLFVISGLGLVSCVLLSLMMQHLLKVKVDRKRSPLVIELEELFRSQLAGPIETEVQERDGKRTLVVHLKIVGGIQKQRLGISLGGLIWRRVLSGPDEAPQALLLSVSDDAGGKLEEVPVTRPPMLGGPVPAPPPAKAPPPAAPTKAPPPAAPAKTSG